jgi:glucose-1-phosphate adenylyltransferase
MDYLSMLNFHLVHNADLTVGVVMVPRQEGKSLGIIHVDADSRVINFLEKPAEPPGIPDNPEVALASMGVYIFRAESLVQEVIQDAKQSDSQHDFGRNIIPHMVGRKRVFAYNFAEGETGQSSYWRDIGQLDAYFEAHLDLLGEAPVFNLFDPEWPMRGHPTLTPPAKYITWERPVSLEDCLIAGGCILEEAKLRRSVLSPSVQVGRGAEIDEAILWEGVKVGAGAKIRRAIIEDGVTVPPDFTIGHDREADARRFTITAGGLVIVPNNVRLEHN